MSRRDTQPRLRSFRGVSKRGRSTAVALKIQRSVAPDLARWNERAGADVGDAGRPCASARLSRRCVRTTAWPATRRTAASQQAAAMAKQSQSSLTRATQAIQAMQAVQNAARNGRRWQAHPANVPNGLGAGGLQVAPGVGSRPDAVAERQSADAIDEQRPDHRHGAADRAEGDPDLVRASMSARTPRSISTRAPAMPATARQQLDRAQPRRSIPPACRARSSGRSRPKARSI